MDRVSGELHAPAALLLAGKDFGGEKKPGLEFGGSRAGLGVLENRKVTALPATEIGLPGRSFKL
jgi:hypothetical protein